MHRLHQVIVGAALAACATGAHAGFVFTPHVSEYSVLPPGQYSEATFVFTDIQDIYNRDGKKVHTGAPFLEEGEDVFASLMLFKSLWIGNVFRDTGIWFLKDHSQFCRAIGVLGWQQASGKAVDRDLTAGQSSGAAGLGDLFTLCGIYGDIHQWGPVKANALFATTVKVPIGQYDQDSLLNIGTNYWSYVPQLAYHAEFFGRVFLDGTFAYQFKGSNDRPSFGGLTPTRPADMRNFENNVAWKLNEHWFIEAGYSWRETVGPNRYDQYSLNLKDQPIQAQSACDNTNNGLGVEIIDQGLCNSTSAFFIEPQAGPYYDRGIQGTLVTAGFVYIYRTSSVLNLRVAMPVEGRGGQIDAVYDIYSAEPDGNGGYTRGSDTGLDTITRQNTVQEAASVSASPYYEARFVYLFWAP